MVGEGVVVVFRVEVADVGSVFYFFGNCEWILLNHM